MIGDLFDSPWKILIVAVVIIVLFGSRKLPHAARSLGQSMRILKTEVQGLHEDEPDSPATQGAQAAPAELQQAPVPVPVPVPEAQAQIRALQQQISSLRQTAAASRHAPRGHHSDSLSRGPREMG
ncbi:MAG TPA: Sec-independent protein translocase subunit TatA [Trebonia sp.]|jgi:sec-independent protein translocase protein TatA|nr:Sec-independent protein translocase subunit TatA [Trebonia sp.]